MTHYIRINYSMNASETSIIFLTKISIFWCTFVVAAQQQRRTLSLKLKSALPPHLPQKIYQCHQTRGLLPWSAGGRQYRYLRCEDHCPSQCHVGLPWPRAAEKSASEKVMQCCTGICKNDIAVCFAIFQTEKQKRSDVTLLLFLYQPIVVQVTQTEATLFLCVFSFFHDTYSYPKQQCSLPLQKSDHAAFWLCSCPSSIILS